MIEVTLKYIEEQLGLKLKLCDHFTGINEMGGIKYFNVVLKERTSESDEYIKLKRFSDKYKTIRIESNGLKRVAVFVETELSH